MRYTAANAATTSESGAGRCELVVSFFILVCGARLAGKQKPTAGLPAMGCEILRLLDYGFNLSSPAVCAIATLRSHATRFGIQVSLAKTGFIIRETGAI